MAGRTFLLPVFLIALACSQGGEAITQDPAPSPAPKPAVLAVRASADLAARTREGGFFRWGVPRLPGLKVEVGPEASGDAVVWVTILPASRPVADLLKGLPVELGDAIVLGGTRYPEPGQALALRIPEAVKPTWVVAGPAGEGLTALADEVLFRLAASMTGLRRGRRGAPLDVDYLLRETPWMERSGKWARAAEGGWSLDRAAERDDLAEWDRAFKRLAPLGGRHVLVLVPPAEHDRPELARLAIQLDLAVREMASRVPVELPASPSPSLITVVVEPDYAAQGRHAGEIGEAVRGRRADLHLVYHPDDLPAYRYALAGVLLDRAGLAAKLPPEIAHGAALWLSRDWYGKPYPDWLPLLAAARVLPDAEEILAREEPEDSSNLLATPAAAAVIDRLSGSTLKEKLAQLPSSTKVGEIFSSFRLATEPPAVPARKQEPFLKGVSLAMLNSLEGGYHAPAVEKQLDALSKLGANAVSLMPFAFQPGADRPELRFLNRGPSSETDIGLIHAARAARARGIRVLWKPHVWVSGASWPGEIAMKSEGDWAAWWRSYRRYVLHHALLARWAGADLFCVGVELSKTVGREAEWRDLIAAVRLVYPGPVTYAANWYGDLETVRFWDRLDLIGVDTYFPLAEKPGAGRAELERGARLVAERLARASRRSNKPVLLTEVGFAAKREAWMEPHVEGGGYSEDDQAAAYEALLAALDHHPWLAGTFVWKAFSGQGSDGGREADFRFQGRKAEGVVSRYYGGDPRR
ncbi:MAG: glycoside hydrolase family 113 [Thermoanaerobaculia bacterium]